MSRVSREYFRLDLGVLRPDRWFFQPGSARTLAAVRIGLCALLALRVGLRPSLYLDLSQQEASLFRPLSWAKLFDHMPSRGVLLAALIVCVIAAACAAAGFKGRIALPIAWREFNAAGKDTPDEVPTEMLVPVPTGAGVALG